MTGTLPRVQKNLNVLLRNDASRHIGTTLAQDLRVYSPSANPTSPRRPFGASASGLETSQDFGSTSGRATAPIAPLALRKSRARSADPRAKGLRDKNGRISAFHTALIEYDPPSMLSARRKSDGTIVAAYFSTTAHGPFACPTCNEEVILKTGRNNVDHFAHANPIACKFAEGESNAHRLCKLEIYEALLKAPNVRGAALERPVGNNRPDVSAYINGVPVAIEIQISSLSHETIQGRTLEYARYGIYVLWLLQWTPDLDAVRYAPRHWEKWIHAVYFGRVYYWTSGLSVISYHFDPHFISVPRKSWYSKDGNKQKGGGYSRRSDRYRKPIRGRTFDLAKDFAPSERGWWEGNGLMIPAAKLFMDENAGRLAAKARQDRPC